MNESMSKKFFKKNKDIEFALLFGSHAKGHANKMSDVDIAVCLSPRVAASKFFDLRLSLAAELPIKGKKDVVILNESPPLLAYEVASHGKPIFIRNKKALIDFKASAFSRFFDTQVLRNVQYEAMVKRIKEGKIGHFKRNSSIKVDKIRELSRKIARAGKAH